MLPGDKELERLRNDMEAYAMPDVGNILHKTKTSDNEGSWTETWGTVTANVPCRVELVQRNLGIGVEQVSGASLKPFSTWVLTLPYDTTITSANRFEFGGDVYNVTEVNNNSSWMGNIRATLEKI